MSELETLNYRGTDFPVGRTVLDRMGLVAGQSVSQEELWEITRIEKEDYLAEVDAQRVAGKQYVLCPVNICDLLRRCRPRVRS
ncbi:MAG: hypothetical protein Q7S95_01430 [bacterium]|nr:hypothetical protein [bacterium]